MNHVLAPCEWELMFAYAEVRNWGPVPSWVDDTEPFVGWDHGVSVAFWIDALESALQLPGGEP